MPVIETLRHRVGGQLSSIRRQAVDRLVLASDRIRQPIGKAQSHVEGTARKGWDKAVSALRDTLDVPARADLERLGRRLETVQQHLETIGRDRLSGPKSVTSAKNLGSKKKQSAS